MVIIASLTVFFTDQSVGKYADPIMSIVSAVLLLWLSYPYSKYTKTGNKMLEMKYWLKIKHAINVVHSRVQ